MAIDRFNLVLKSTKQLTPNTRHFEFACEDGRVLGFIPGQFVTLFLMDPSGKAKRRSYSLANEPGTQLVELAISYVTDGLASKVLFDLKEGDKVEAMGPAGKFILPEKDTKKRYIFIATGTGVGPYRAMLSDIALRLHEDPDFQVVLLLGVRGREDLLYGDEFVAFGQLYSQFSFYAQYSRETATDFKHYEHKGYVQEALPNLTLDPAKDRIFLCGNPAMIDASCDVLKKLNFLDADLHYEKYRSNN